MAGTTRKKGATHHVAQDPKDGATGASNSAVNDQSSSGHSGQPNTNASALAGPTGHHSQPVTGYGHSNHCFDSTKDIIQLEKPSDYRAFETTFIGFVYEKFEKDIYNDTFSEVEKRKLFIILHTDDFDGPKVLQKLKEYIVLYELCSQSQIFCQIIGKFSLTPDGDMVTYINNKSDFGQY